MAKLAPFDFEIRYIPGPKNVVADALSRLTKVPYGALMEEANAFNPECVQDAFRRSCDPQAMLQMPHFSTVASRSAVAGPLSLSISQEAVSAVLGRSLNQEHPPPQAFLLPQQSIQPREFRLTIKTGVLYLVSKDAITKRKTYQYVVPSALKEKVLRGVHDEAGHQGQSRTLYLSRQRFYWHGMERDIRGYVRCCRRCVLSKSPAPEARAPLESITTSRPFELVCIDFWSAEDSSNKSLDVLVVTDHFTKLAQAYLCPNQSAKVVAQQLWNNFFCVYGFPERIHSDQGANFESSLIAEMLLVAGVQKSHTIPYHPMGNGAVERFNHTLGSMIRALPPKQVATTAEISYLLL